MTGLVVFTRGSELAGVGRVSGSGAGVLERFRSEQDCVWVCWKVSGITGLFKVGGVQVWLRFTTFQELQLEAVRGFRAGHTQDHKT